MGESIFYSRFSSTKFKNGKNKRKLVEKAIGKYIFWFDQDDYLE